MAKTKKIIHWTLTALVLIAIITTIMFTLGKTDMFKTIYGVSSIVLGLAILMIGFYALWLKKLTDKKIEVADAGIAVLFASAIISVVVGIGLLQIEALTINVTGWFKTVGIVSQVVCAVTLLGLSFAKAK